ncbi:MAG: ribosome silencing factor [Saprospiraceae bacterium]|nr:ribosome silencing factor [Saprospiraceae bacterium]
MSKRPTATAKLKEEDKALNDLIIDAIQDIKGKKIVKLDLRSIDDAPADFFIICQGDSTVQIKAISLNIEKRVRAEMGVKNIHIEGMLGAKWVLVDFFNTVVHIFYPETREYYDLEDLWSDALTTEYPDV